MNHSFKSSPWKTIPAASHSTSTKHHPCEGVRGEVCACIHTLCFCIAPVTRQGPKILEWLNKRKYFLLLILKRWRVESSMQVGGAGLLTETLRVGTKLTSATVGTICTRYHIRKKLKISHNQASVVFAHIFLSMWIFC